MKGEIKITMEGVGFEETERLRTVIQNLILQGALHVRNGKAVLNFDNNGLLRQISLDYVKWRDDKPSETLANNLKNVIIETEVSKTS